jgi:hypothetical protein
VELWEVQAREEIRDLVTRYNSNGDTGRFGPMMELFADHAVMETQGGRDGELVRREGKAAVESIFTGAKENWAEPAVPGAPVFIRHNVATHQIDVEDETHAKGRCYFHVNMAWGLDHWGRYIDTYEKIDGRWLFTYRKVLIDGRVGEWAPPSKG